MRFSSYPANRAAQAGLFLFGLACFSQSSLSIAQDVDLSSKTFADFKWDETEERVPIPGAVELGKQVPMLDLIRFYEQRVEKNPTDIAGLSMLGKLYFRHAKEADDLPYYAKAAKTLGQALELFPESASVKLRLAEVLASQHRFKDGLQLASEVLDRDPELSLALAIKFDCQLELGRYDDAKASLDALLMMETSSPVLARQSRFAELTGHPDEAVLLMDKAIEDLEAIGGEPEDLKWYHWRKATLLLSQGKIADAKQLHEQILTVDGNDTASLFGLAEAQRASGEHQAAMPSVQKVIDLQQAPPAMALMGDLYADAGNAAAAEQWYQKTEAAMRAELLVAGDAHAREVALFFADHQRHPAEAVAMAIKDFERREDIYTYDTLAWCQHQAGDHAAALKAMKQAMKLSTQDAKLFYHAAKIYAAAGDSVTAASMLAQAKKLNPYLPGL